MFCTNAYKRSMPQEFRDFVPEEGAKYWDYWGYENEEELREILREFKRLILTYGLDFFETISKPPTDAVPTEEKNRYLYEHHRELFEEYQERLGTKGKKAEEVIEIIYDAMREMLDEPFSKVEDMLVGVAALYGHTICGDDTEKWSWNRESQVCVIKQPMGTQTDENILKTIILSWNYRKRYRRRKKENPLFKAYTGILKASRQD